jgi:hypothetical protein
MALKGDRQEITHDISFFNNDTTAERGGICVFHTTVGSGAALDQAINVATYVTANSGKIPIGMLLNDIVNVNQAKYHVNFHKNESQTGSKCVLMTEGWAVTNMLIPAIAPAVGQVALLSQSGLIGIVGSAGIVVSDTAVGTNKIGRFMSQKDEDGYAKIYVKLPNVGIT